MAHSSDPFDFSDFSSAQSPASPQYRDSGAVEPGRAPSSWSAQGFDAYSPADLPPTAASPSSGEFRADQASAVVVTGRPPVVWLVASAIAVLAGVVLGIVGGSSGVVAIAAWLLAGPVGIGLLAVFTLHDTGQRAMPVYQGGSWSRTAYWVILACAGVGISLGAWHIADWIGRL